MEIKAVSELDPMTANQYRNPTVTPRKVLVSTLAAGAVMFGSDRISNAFAGESGDTPQPTAQTSQTEEADYIPYDKSQAEHCATIGTAEPMRVEMNLVKGSSKKIKFTARFEGTSPNGATYRPCDYYGVRSVVAWEMQEDNRHKMRRNNKPATLPITNKVVKGSAVAKLMKPYTCEPGTGKRKTSARVRVTWNASKEGTPDPEFKRSRTYRVPYSNIPKEC